MTDSHDKTRCPYCDGEELPTRHLAKEMMFGLGGSFEYSECSLCRSLWLRTPPVDASPFYPANYYSLAAEKRSYVRRWIRRMRFRTQWRGLGALGKVSRLVLGTERIAAWLSAARVSRADAVLDVGCGGGVLLDTLRDFGFNNVTGVDPYVLVERDEPGFRIVRGELNAATGPYQLAIFNHSLEHLASPSSELKLALGKLESHGELLIRIPVAGCWAWRTYGVHWVQLDAPRHVTIPSERGLRVLAANLNCDVDTVFYDSTPFQLWASERYRDGVPLYPRGSDAAASLAPKGSGTKDLAQRAELLNDQSDGDQMVVLLRKRG